MDTSAYRRRVGDDGDLAPTLQTLRRLHLAHMTSVPFENLDIPLGRPIRLDEGAFFRKMVEGRRGGFCYEQNGLFGAVLRQLGFRVTLLSARVVNQGVVGPEFDHLALQVDLPEGRWLADVGFGRSFREPLSLDTGAPAEAEGATYRVVAGQPDWHVQFQLPGKPAQREYVFSLTPRRLEDFAPMCQFHQTSPASPFTRKRLCTLATTTGRLTFLNGTFVEERTGVREEHLLAAAEVGPILRDRFGVSLPDDDVRGWAARS